MNDKRGQGLSLNVIIIAIIALVVLVVLIAIFTGKMGYFQEGIDKEGQTELISLKLGYGDCHPSKSSESSFSSDFASAELSEEKDLARSRFKSVISRCKSFSENKDVCESESGCTWS